MNNGSSFSTGNPEDYLNSTAVFAEIKKTVLSKTFKGGTIYNLFGAIKLDFTNADLSGMAVLDISQGFGEIKIRVPYDWRIETDFSQLFTTVSDKRINKTQIDTNKLLVLKGVSFFANVDILSIKEG